MLTYDEHQRQNDEHAKCPKAGDYWHECFYPIMLVLDVSEFAVSFLSKTTPTDADHWTWDVSQVSTLSRVAFNKKLRYDTMPDKCHAMVVPDWKHAQEFIAAAKEVSDAE